MEVELILMRQLASYLAIPIFVVGMDGKLLFYNQPAERLLGKSFDEAGEMPLKDLTTIFDVTAADGSPLTPDTIPLAIALREHRGAHASLRFRGLDGVERRVGVTAFPIDGQGGRRLGAAAVFWEEPEG